MATWCLRLSLICMLLILPSQAARTEWQIGYSEPVSPNDDEVNPKTWAVLIAGSRGYGNYRHQADVCHAYQILRRGGLNDENIIVFMYDDIANHKVNPRPGVIINNPKGDDVYAGVPKDYTGNNLTISNFFSVLLGDKDSVKGGSGKVLDSKSNDRVFIFYSDHGGYGALGMPKGPLLYGNDFVEVLKKMHAARRYKEMVIYLEACESGSIFEGVLTDDLNIYVTTASNSSENSWATYCPYIGLGPSPPPEYKTCLGDLYSVAWMEDSDKEFSKKETLKTQYEKVKLTANHNSSQHSHVMEYGTMSINSEPVSLYQGNGASSPSTDTFEYAGTMGVIDQREADLIFLRQMYKNADEGSEEEREALKQITDVMNHRKHLDDSVDEIGVYLFGDEEGRLVLTSVRGQGMPVVDDWGCLKSMVRLFETHCGSLTQYGMKHMRAFANICNSGIIDMMMEKACADVCHGYNMGQWDPVIFGYSA